MSHSDKLGFRWLGPFRIREALTNGSYLVEELDGTAFRHSVHGNRLKIYYTPAAVEDDGDFALPSIFGQNSEGPTVNPRTGEEARAEPNLRALIPEGQTFAVVIP